MHGYFSHGAVIQGTFPHGIPPHLTRFANVPVQRHAAPGARATGTVNAIPLPPNIANFARGAGEPLRGDIRQMMERAFATSFADVRIHVGQHASAIGALAFTTGSQIHFAPGQYAPESVRGGQMLAHELAHVVQQRSGRIRNPFGSGVAVVHDPALEAEADRFARQITVQLSRRATIQMGKETTRKQERVSRRESSNPYSTVNSSRGDRSGTRSRSRGFPIDDAPIEPSGTIGGRRVWNGSRPGWNADTRANILAATTQNIGGQYECAKCQLYFDAGAIQVDHKTNWRAYVLGKTDSEQITYKGYKWHVIFTDKVKVAYNDMANLQSMCGPCNASKNGPKTYDNTGCVMFIGEA